MGKIPHSKLRTVMPVYSGLQILKDDIQNQSEVLCTCKIAVNYHVGAFDALETLKRASSGEEKREVLLIQDDPDAKLDDDTLFKPKNPQSPLKESLNDEVDYVRGTVKRVYEGLIEIDKKYVIGKSLSDQNKDFRERFLKCFLKLIAARYLPETVGNSAFNHQGMYLLMEKCFSDHSAFIDYMRNPDLADFETDGVRELSRMRSLERGYDERRLASSLIENNWMGLNLLLFLRERKEASLREIERQFSLRSSDFGPGELLILIVNLHDANAIVISPSGVSVSKEGQRLLDKIDQLSKDPNSL